MKSIYTLSSESLNWSLSETRKRYQAERISCSTPNSWVYVYQKLLFLQIYHRNQTKDAKTDQCCKLWYESATITLQVSPWHPKNLFLSLLFLHKQHYYLCDSRYTKYTSVANPKNPSASLQKSVQVPKNRSEPWFWYWMIQICARDPQGSQLCVSTGYSGVDMPEIKGTAVNWTLIVLKKRGFLFEDLELGSKLKSDWIAVETCCLDRCGVCWGRTVTLRDSDSSYWVSAAASANLI